MSERNTPPTGIGPGVQMVCGVVDYVSAAGTIVKSSSTIGSITLTSGGSGYTAAPTVTISGGGGSSATATATVTNGVVTGTTITNAGSGYTGTPTVAFTAPETAQIPCPFTVVLGAALEIVGVVSPASDERLSLLNAVVSSRIPNATAGSLTLVRTGSVKTPGLQVMYTLFGR